MNTSANPAVQAADRARAETIEEIRALSRAMCEAARAGRWEELVVLEAARRALLAPLFSEPLRGEGPLAVLAREIIAGDREILALAEPARRELEQALLALGQGRRALRAYGQCAGALPP